MFSTCVWDFLKTFLILLVVQVNSNMAGTSHSDLERIRRAVVLENDLKPSEFPLSDSGPRGQTGSVKIRVKRDKLKQAYKETFYLNPGWFVRYNPVPKDPYIATIGSNLFPEPQYGILNFQNFPPPLPPPPNPKFGPQISNFAGYVGPVGWLPEAYENMQRPEDHMELYEGYKYYDS